jgi:CDP-4-dehydro-6-deoxyglucose reductase, E1
MWSLNINNFSLKDRLKICKFILSTKNRWTQDIQVRSFEREMANYVGCKYSVYVSSGSTANELIAQYHKSVSGGKNIVVFPSTTWQTSCSPWIRNGFTPHFVDISLEDFSIDKDKLTSYMESNGGQVACIFPTSLIGFSPDMDFYTRLKHKYKVNIAFDNCENTFGEFKDSNISSYFTSSTSTYFGHQIQSIEGGFIFTNSEEEYRYYLINRNHGMVRSLEPYGLETESINNKKVDPLFDFYNLGSNYRNTDLNAFIGLLDFKRIPVYTKTRKDLYNRYRSKLDKSKFFLPQDRLENKDSLFCLPVISQSKDASLIDKARALCKDHNIEYRPIISGFLGYQTCYKKYFSSHDEYKNSIYIHNQGFYIGLHQGVKKQEIDFIVNKLNSL